MRPWIITTLAGLAVSLPALAGAQDGDADGVPDLSDARPCDPAVVAVSYAPASDDHAMLVFEDQFPSSGDRDFNDAVISYRYRLELDANGDAVRLVALLSAPAMGGDTLLGLGLHLPVNASSIASLTRTFEGQTPQPLSLQTDAQATALLSTDLRADLYPGVFGPVNVRGTPVQGLAMQVVFTFAPGTNLSIAGAPYDLFVVRSQDNSHEIHLPQYSGTQAMNTALFGTADDASQPGRAFVDNTGLPFALHLPTQVPYPAEGVSIATLYPRIISFAASGGSLDADFYSSQVVASASFTNPTVLSEVSPAEVVDTSCVVPGHDPALPGTMCKDILASGGTADGIYWIDPDGPAGRPSFQAYCDMSTAGGGWTGILPNADRSYAYLSRFDLSEVNLPNYSVNSTYGATWGTTVSSSSWGADVYRVRIAVPYDEVRMTYSGWYNSPSGGLGRMNVGNQHGNGQIISFGDAHTSSGSGQTLTVGGQNIFVLSRTNVVQRTDHVLAPGSTRLHIAMNGYTSSYGYTRRYIGALWVR